MEDDIIRLTQHRYNRYLPLAKYDEAGRKPFGFFMTCTHEEFASLMMSLEVQHRLSVEARAKELYEKGVNGTGECL